MKHLVFITGVFLVGFLVETGATVVPSKLCTKGLLDPEICNCECSPLGEVDQALYCWVANQVCAAIGVDRKVGCCPNPFTFNFQINPLDSSSKESSSDDSSSSSSEEC